MNYYVSVLKNYANFKGRARRAEYWQFVLINAIISGLLTFVLPLQSIYSLAVLLPSLGVLVRRMHDVGKSGWFGIIPIYNIILACTEGDKGSNEYGEDPKM